MHEEQAVPLWDHIAELSRRIRVWITAFIIATVFFLLAPGDTSFLANPLGVYRPFIADVLQAIRTRILPSNVQLIAGSFTAPIMLYFVASAVFGFVVTVPVFAFEVYKFVNPALSHNERRSASPFVLGFSILFLAGAIFGFFVMTPLVVWSSLYFFGFTGAVSLIRIDDFYNLVFFTTVASGLAFTLPIFLVLLVKFNVVQTRLFTKNRLYLYIAVYVLTGVVTPDGNPVSDILLFTPIILLIEGALLVARRYDKHRPVEDKRPEVDFLRCAFCNGPIDAGGVFCGRCGRARL
ncbi:MAG TPA: twin-arginine translocase subunit TatC [Candidatus Binatus sp.]|nr:twin-arginine translocase subunit TatC [Candidatus Binatus sp.]